MTERLREEQNQRDKQNDNRACGHVRGAGFERNKCGHLNEHHYDGNLKEGDRGGVNGCAYFAWIVDVVDVVAIDEVLDGHKEETYVGRARSAVSNQTA